MGCFICVNIYEFNNITDSKSICVISENSLIKILILGINDK